MQHTYEELKAKEGHLGVKFQRHADACINTLRRIFLSFAFSSSYSLYDSIKRVLFMVECSSQNISDC